MGKRLMKRICMHAQAAGLAGQGGTGAYWSGAGGGGKKGHCGNSGNQQEGVLKGACKLQEWQAREEQVRVVGGRC